MIEEAKYKFIIFNIQKNYNFLSNILLSLQYHYINLYENNIITLYEKNINLNYISEEIKTLNINYNFLIVNKIDKLIECLDKLNFSIEYLEESNYPIYRNYMKNIFNLEYNLDLNIILFSLDENRDKLIKLSQKNGCSSLKEILELVYKLELNMIYTKKMNIFIEFLNKVFLPLNFEIINKKTEFNFNDDLNDESIENYLQNINIKYKTNNNDELLNKVVEIHINHITGKIILNGLFKLDSINIIFKTCQIANKFFYYKKKKLEKLLEKCRATKKFSKMFFKILTIDETMCYDETNFVEFVDSNYDKYMNIIGMSFMNIMKDFIKKNNTITEMFITIKLLLLGNEENINIAGLLFEITKDKKINSNLIYNLIYKNLHYTLQVKIKKSVSDIKENLKKIQNLSNNDIDFKKQIISLKYMPLYVKSLCLEKIEEMKSSNNEYYKQQLYVKTLIKYPWSSISEDIIFNDLNKDISKRKFYITDIDTKLTKLTYGHQETKKSLIEIIAKWISNPVSGGSSIALCGPPGVGKTLLAKSVSTILNIPFAHISLGGQNDGEILHGHGYTYSGSQPGIIIKKMSDIGKSRIIIYFDELDKVCQKNGSNEISNILIHLTDPNMNKTFQDRFFQGIDFPLDKVIFIFSYNDRSKIDPILLDRFLQINIKPYSLDDKIKLFKQFLFKEVCESIGFIHTDFKISDNVIKFLINNYTLEAGVRELKRKLEKIILSLNVDRLYQRNLFKNNKKKIILTKSLIENLLTDDTFEIEKIHSKPLVGIINGLYATQSGFGGIVPIQITSNYFNNDSSFSLRLTGSQGDVMKESVQCALTCALDYIERNKEKFNITNLKEHVQNNWKSGFHIHAPNGATPKDGPSAGSAFTTAFISRIIDKKIRNDVAMTGEIDLLGNVTKIGGLEYKINGAKKAGIKTILLSIENKIDLEKIKKKDSKITNNITIHFVKVIDEIIKYALIL